MQSIKLGKLAINVLTTAVILGSACITNAAILVKNGKIEYLNVIPKEREGDIVFPENIR